MTGGANVFVDGVAGRALRIGPGSAQAALHLESRDLPLGKTDNFSIQFWVRTSARADQRMVLLGQKSFPDNSLVSQKHAGWVFYLSGGTWAWNIGSGARRLTYERDNGRHMPLNDGAWHQLTMTYEGARSQVRLYYDGVNAVVYNVDDTTGFDFANSGPLVVGWDAPAVATESRILPSIERGVVTLQAFVDAFHALGAGALTADEFVPAIVDPKAVFGRKAAAMPIDASQVDFSRLTAAERELMRNPYTVHQVIDFMEPAPLRHVYALVDGTVTIRPEGAVRFAAQERLDRPEFDIDELSLSRGVMTPTEVLRSYTRFRPAPDAAPVEPRTTVTTAVWNIWHGGKHFTTEEHGWDSRIAIADMIREHGVDVVMMQESYSSGDFIAAELGYVYATTVDWDYLNQGENISVISRFPIADLFVPKTSAFMNVGITAAVGPTQSLHVMSNWYGMDQFPAVFAFHQDRFQQADRIPVLFGGDFNAVPHTEGGSSPASRALLGAGFRDAFRESFPDPRATPGPTHMNGERIDQLYYKGASLTHAQTRVIASRGAGFPSDHSLIISTFALRRP